MKDGIYFVFILFFVFSPVFHAQQPEGINAKPLAQYIREEKQQGAIRVLNDKNVRTVSGELDQVVFVYPDASLPGIDKYIRYVYFKQDSSVAEIRWEWDIANHNEKLKNPKDSSFRIRMANFYRQWENYLSAKMGPGSTEGLLPEKLYSGKTYTKSVSWMLPAVKVRLEIVMRNTYKPEKHIYPEHKVVLSFHDILSPRMTKYGNGELVKRIRKPQPYIDIPVKGAPVPLLPGCSDPKESYNCMNAYIAKRLEEKFKHAGLYIRRDTLRISFRVNHDGTVTLLSGTYARNKDVMRLGEEVIHELPRFKPAYDSKRDQNVAAGYSLLFSIQDNKVKFGTFKIPLK